MHDRSEETELATAYVVVLAEAASVALFLVAAFVWLAVIA